MTDDERLALIRERVDAATPGPWATCNIAEEGLGCIPHQHMDVYTVPGQQNVFCAVSAAQDRTQEIKDLAFAAHAREDVPWLIARVRELEAGWADECTTIREKCCEDYKKELQAKIADLEADKARLDWLENHGISVYWDTGRVSWCAIRYDETSDADWPYQVMYAHGSFKNVVDWAMAHPKELEMIVDFTS